MEVTRLAERLDLGRRARAVVTPLMCYALTSAIVLLGIQFGRAFLRPSPLSANHSIPPTFLASLAGWDGSWYGSVATEGYSSRNAGFFPAYPLIGRAVAYVTGFSIQGALVLVSHLALVPALAIFYAYARRRAADDESAPGWALASAALLPTTFYFRMAYSESLLVLAMALFLYGTSRRWPDWTLALISGFACAVRPVGIALLAPLAIGLFGEGGRGRLWTRAAIMVLGGWGLWAYMIFCAASLHDPVAFATAQRAWHVLHDVPLGRKVVALLSFAPVRFVYNTSSPTHFSRMGPPTTIPFNLYFANPIYFMLAVVLVAVGAWKRWLDRREVALAAGLILIPYVTQAYETTMYSMGRYMAVVIPIYLVLGQLLRRAPVAVSASLLALCGLWLGTYAALYGLGYWLV